MPGSLSSAISKLVIALKKRQNILMMVSQSSPDEKNGPIAGIIQGVSKLFRFPRFEGHSENSKLVWLVRLRWTAIALFFCMAAPAYIFEALNRSTFTIFIGIIGFLFMFNLLTQMVFVESRRPVGTFFIAFQLAFDLAVLSSLLLISGGFGNPFVALFLLNAGLGGVLIKGRHSWPFVVLCHAFLIGLQIQFALENLDLNQRAFFIFVFVSHLLVFSAWFVMRSLGSYLEGHFESVAQVRIQFEKQDRLRALGALAAGFSHEFASPLNAAKLRLDRLERSLEKSEFTPSWIEGAKENLSEAKTSIQNCEFVIRSMNASQLDVRDHVLKSINLAEFIKDVTDSWLEERVGANLEISNSIEIPLVVSPINLAQVLLNLLDNAFEANAKGKILLSLKIENNWVKLSVIDEGQGFSERILGHRGEPFVTSKEHGTGLGLYVSEIFVQSLGGHLSIKNKSDPKGAIVSLNWPLSRNDS